MKSQSNTQRKKVQSFRPPGRLPALAKRQAFSSQVIKRLKKAMPQPECELYYETHFQLLVSVVLSAQTTDKMVNRAMKSIYEKGFTPEQVVAWGQEKLLDKIRMIGLAPTKSKNVVRLSSELLEKFSGEVPRTRPELEALPGVGRKTASVILGELFREPTIAVDTHVYRVTMRLGLHKENSADKTEQELYRVIDPKFLPDAHHWFILLGRYTCKAQRPLCDQCLLADICPSCQV